MNTSTYETAEQRYRREQAEWQRGQSERSLESIDNATRSSLAHVAAREAGKEEHEGHLTAIYSEVQPRVEQLLAAIVHANATGADRRVFERELDALQSVTRAILTGNWSDSHDLEDRLRARGAKPGLYRFFTGWRSLGQTKRELAELRAERAQLETKLEELRAARAQLD